MATIPPIVVPIALELELGDDIQALADGLVAVVTSARRIRVLANLHAPDLHPAASAELDRIAHNIDLDTVDVWRRIFGATFPEVDA